MGSKNGYLKRVRKPKCDVIDSIIERFKPSEKYLERLNDYFSQIRTPEKLDEMLRTAQGCVDVLGGLLAVYELNKPLDTGFDYLKGTYDCLKFCFEKVSGDERKMFLYVEVVGMFEELAEKFIKGLGGSVLQDPVYTYVDNKLNDEVIVIQRRGGVDISDAIKNYELHGERAEESDEELRLAEEYRSVAEHRFEEILNNDNHKNPYDNVRRIKTPKGDRGRPILGDLQGAWPI